MSPTCTTDGQRSHVTKVVCVILYWNMGAHWRKMVMFGAVTCLVSIRYAYSLIRDDRAKYPHHDSWLPFTMYKMVSGSPGCRREGVSQDSGLQCILVCFAKPKDSVQN